MSLMLIGDKIITFFSIKKTKAYLFSLDVRFIRNFAADKAISLGEMPLLHLII